MKALAGTVDGAAEMRADRRKTTECIPFAHDKNTLVIQKRHRAIQIIIGLAGLESLVRLKEDVGHQKPHRAGRGGRRGEDGRQPAERKLEKTAS